MLSRSPWERFRSDRRAVACLLILCAELLAVLLLPPLLGLEQRSQRLHLYLGHILQIGCGLPLKIQKGQPNIDAFLQERDKFSHIHIRIFIVKFLQIRKI